MQGIRGGPAEAARDPQLFEEFYRRHVDAVTSFVARRVADAHTVADLTAEVFLAVLDSAHTANRSPSAREGAGARRAADPASAGGRRASLDRSGGWVGPEP